MWKSRIPILAIAALACLMSVPASAQPEPPDGKAYTVASQPTAPDVILFTAPAAVAVAMAPASAHKPAHGGYPGMVHVRVLDGTYYHMPQRVPMRGQPGYRT